MDLILTGVTDKIDTEFFEGKIQFLSERKFSHAFSYYY